MRPHSLKAKNIIVFRKQLMFLVKLNKNLHHIQYLYSFSKHITFGSILIK